MTPTDEQFLRRAIALAFQARERGADPFGAVLVRANEIVYEAEDGSVEFSDPTYHAEVRLISEYCRRYQQFSLDGFIIYCSAEPCLMCCGAIHWSKISRVVFSISQTMLQEYSGGRPKYSANDLLNIGHKHIEVIGPMLVEEGRAVFNDYVFRSKVERHRERFSQ